MGVSQQLNPLLFFLRDLFQPDLFLSALIVNFLPILNLVFHLFWDHFGNNQGLMNPALLLVLWNVAVCTFRQLNNWIVHLFIYFLCGIYSTGNSTQREITNVRISVQVLYVKYSPKMDDLISKKSLLK